MKNFIISLKDNLTSQHFTSLALESADKFNWNLEIFDAIDGRKSRLEDYDLFPTTLSKKPRKSMDRPGVVGCFLSHYVLWHRCIDLQEPIGIFEQDVLFLKPNTNTVLFEHVLRFDKPKIIGKNYGTGVWWGGSYAYLVTPEGSKRLIEWSKKFGALPSDMMLGLDVVDIQFNLDNIVALNLDSLESSLTKVQSF